MIHKVTTIIIFVLISLALSQPSGTTVIRKLCDTVPMNEDDTDLIRVLEPNICYDNKIYYCNEDGNPMREITCINPGLDPVHLDTNCDNENEYYYECVPFPLPNEEDYIKVMSCEEEECAFITGETIYVKPSTCVKIDETYYKYIIAGEYVRVIEYEEMCTDDYYESYMRIFKVGVIEPYGEPIYKKFSFEVDMEQYKYLHIKLIEFASHILETNVCFPGNMKLYMFKKYNSVLIIEYSDENCEGSINDIEIGISEYYTGMYTLPHSKNYHYASEYKTMEDCMARNHQYYIIFHIDDNLCMEYGTNGHFDFNQTHAKFTGYNCADEESSESSCNEYDCTSISRIENYAYNECHQVNNVFAIFYQNVLNYFEDMECDTDMNCKSKGVVHLVEDIIIESNITITNSSVVVMNYGNEFGFIVGENGNLDLQGGQILLNINDDTEFEDFISKFDDTDQVILTIVKGKYSGKFHEIGVEKPQDSKKCEDIQSEFDYQERMVNALFTLDKSNCGLKWWIILVIVVSIVAFILAIVSIVIYVRYRQNNVKTKEFRGNKKSKEESAEMGTFVQNDKKIYEGKGRVNPLYEV